MSSKPLTPATTLRQRARFYTVEWYWASRPVTLTASVVPVLVGSALAFQEGQGSGLLLALMLLASVLVQVGMNLVDEYADDATPARGRKLLAPYKVIARGVLSRRAVQQGAWLSFGVATAIGVYIVVAAGWPILAVCVASLAAAYFYAAGPKPLGTLGLGVPLVFVFMGPVMVMAAYSVHTGESTLESFWVSLPVACLVTAILVANDLRDIEEDRESGKVTLVTALGPTAGKALWTLLVTVALATAVGLALGGQTLWVLLPLLTLPRLAQETRRVWRGHDRPALAMALRATATLHGWFGLLLVAGLGLGT